MNTPPPDLREASDPPATLADRMMLALLFIALPLGTAATIWWNL